MFILSQLWQKRFVIQYTIFHPFPALAETLCYMYNMYNTLFHPFPALAKTLCYTMYNFSSFPSYDEYIDTLSKRLLSPNYILIWSTQHFIYPQLLLRYGWAFCIKNLKLKIYSLWSTHFTNKNGKAFFNFFLAQLACEFAWICKYLQAYCIQHF